VPNRRSLIQLAAVATLLGCAVIVGTRKLTIRGGA
jgi:hypothetical protein